MLLRRSLPLFFTLSVLGVSRVAVAQETEPAPSPPPSVLPQAPASPPSVVPVPPTEVQARRIPTSIDSGAEKNAVLERRVSTEEQAGRMLLVVPFSSRQQTWEQVCVAPCKVSLDRHSSYRVAAENGMPGTRPFTLPPGSDQLQLQVTPGNLFVHRVALRLIAVGIAAAVVGGALVTVASKFDEEKDVRVAGFVTGGAGILTLAVGIPLAILTQTHVLAGEKKLADGASKPRFTAQGFVF